MYTEKNSREYLCILALWFLPCIAAAQPVTNCADMEMDRILRILAFGATNVENKKDISRPTITVANTNGAPVLNATVFYKRRKNNYNQESDTLHLQAEKLGNRFVFAGKDSVQAPYGGAFIISTPAYIAQEYPVYKLPQNLFLPIVLGQPDDVFVPVFNLLFPLRCSTEFLEFATVFNHQRGNKGMMKEYHEQPCEPALAAWLNSISIRYSLGAIAGPFQPAPSAGFDNNFTRSYGLSLPKDSIKRKWILNDISANALYRPKGLFYLYTPEKNIAFGVRGNRFDFAFPMNTPDSLIKQWLAEKGFKAEEPIREYDYMGQIDTRKHAIAHYSGIICTDMLKKASALVVSGRALNYRFAEL
jgi:hypothetical protein